MRTKLLLFGIKIKNIPACRTLCSQIIDKIMLRIKDINTRATAAGLKICFLPTAKIYFEAMAKLEAQKARMKKFESLKESAGEMIKARIRAVMYVDSGLLGAL